LTSSILPSPDRLPTAPDARPTWMEITPQGVRHPRKSLAESLSEVMANLGKVAFVIRCNIRRDAFGTSLGRLWMIIEPILQATTYFLLLKVILGVRGRDVEFVFIFSAITFWRSHATLSATSPNLIQSRGYDVVQNNLPLQMLYLEFFGTEAILFLMRLAILLAVLLASGVPPHTSWLVMPLIALVQFMFTVALAVWLSIGGTFLPDFGKFVPFAVSIWWYLSPGLYGLGRVPDWVRPIYEANPFAHIIPALQQALINGEMPEARPLVIIAVTSLLATALASRVLARARYRFFTFL
jgi:lipopolysaccharide transport system permease protein